MNTCSLCCQTIDGAFVEVCGHKYHPGHDVEFAVAMETQPAHDPEDDYLDYGTYDYGG